MSHAVRKAGPADAARLARLLAESFEDDPGFMHTVPGDGRRARLERFWRADLRRYLALGETYTTEDLAGAALWAQPERWRRTPREILAGAPTSARVFGRRLPLAMRCNAVLEKGHPEGPHWHLWALATDPARRGRGVASALIEPVLRHCEEAGQPAHLETAREGNVPFYRRFGFEVSQKIRLPGEGPPMWLMCRKPGASSPSAPAPPRRATTP